MNNEKVKTVTDENSRQNMLMTRVEKGSLNAHFNNLMIYMMIYAVYVRALIL